MTVKVEGVTQTQATTAEAALKDHPIYSTELVHLVEAMSGLAGFQVGQPYRLTRVSATRTSSGAAVHAFRIEGPMFRVLMHVEAGTDARPEAGEQQ